VQGDARRCADLCDALAAGGVTERLIRLHTEAVRSLDEPDGAWVPPFPLPDSCVAPLVQLHRGRGAGDAAARLLGTQVRLHPENPLLCWLAPGFWLEPVRNWVG